MSVKGAIGSTGAVVRTGYLRKLKTSRKKFFVLRSENAESSARLEYYDSEKKFNAGLPPKRSIQLKTCFNINRKQDTKYKHVIALYTKDDSFCVVLDSEEELETWLKALLSLQRGEDIIDGEVPRPTFEHVWQVRVLTRGLGALPPFTDSPRATNGSVYRFCLTDKTLSLVKKDAEHAVAELPLSCIRSCGNLKHYFYLEMGRSSSIGAGELWMDTEDAIIAQNVHQTVFHAMTSSNSSSKEDLGSYRNRSSSATESSKPNAANRRQTHSGMPKPITFMQAAGVTWPGVVNHQRTQSLPLANPVPLTATDHVTSQAPCAGKRSSQPAKCINPTTRERCDSMPSRPRTTSEGNHPIVWQRIYQSQYRPHSLCVRDFSHSPPSGSPVSPPSAPCSTDSAGSSLSIDDCDAWNENETVLGRYSNSLTPDEAIAEIDERPDSPDNYVPMNHVSSDDGYVDMVSPRSRHIMNMSPAASTSSVTSGTPSTDLKFPEYHLDKVSSFFSPSEEEDADRPIRAYSVGSRTEVAKHKHKIEPSATAESARVRAFSVGSKSKKGHSRVLPPQPHPGVKSSSAPILSNSRVPDHMDYLMEVDFSGRNGNSSYLETKPPGVNNKVNSGYVEMRLGRAQEVSPYVDMTCGSSPTRNSFLAMQENIPYIDQTPYVDMTKCSSQLSTSPVKVKNNGYVDMDFSKKDKNDGYVEMTLGNGHERQSSLDEKKKGGKKNRTKSQPITIQQNNTHRKLSTGTPPKMHLPLSTGSYSSLPRQRSRKNSRKDSKDSSSSSLTTPSSSSTIFPISINSPASPSRPEPKTPDNSEYVNYSPAPQPKPSSDYAVMTLGRPEDIAKKLSKVELDESRFRPISEDGSTSPRVGDLPSQSASRPSSTSSEASTLVGSRPSSVNGEQQPRQLHYASLDLADNARNVPQDSGFAYAEIDFIRSQGFGGSTLKH